VVIVAIELLSPIAWPVLRRQMGFDAPAELVWATALLGLLAALPLVIEWFRPGLMGRITGTERPLAPLLVTSIVLVGGFLAWQQRITDRYRTLRPFCLELKSEIEGPGVQMAYFQKLSRSVLFYLEPMEKIRPIVSTEELNDFLGSRAETKVLITRSDFHEELTRALPEGMAVQPTLKERTYPWEKEPKKHEVWIVRDMVK
jgi:hypothetical protein